MDQWAGKSINLMTGMPIVRMSNGLVSVHNECEKYQAYNLAIVWKRC
jgi:hypothetical protein